MLGCRPFCWLCSVVATSEAEDEAISSFEQDYEEIRRIGGAIARQGSLSYVARLQKVCGAFPGTTGQCSPCRALLMCPFAKSLKQTRCNSTRNRGHRKDIHLLMSRDKSRQSGL